MSLEELTAEVESRYAALGESLELSLDRETRNELAVLLAATDPDDPGELVRRAIHQQFQALVETGRLDFHLRQGYDVTYDEFLSGMTYEEMSGAPAPPDDDRRYQF